MHFPVDQNRIVFGTKSGGETILAGETVIVTADLRYGIPTANFYTVRVYGRCRSDATVPVTFYIHVADLEEDVLIFMLDNFTVQPGGTVTRTYNVPGPALTVFATAAAGTGSSGIDFGVIGFGPPACSGVTNI